mmetsp:Transcript_10188/g.26443  ORF Transcript_10188/g.26443 Transcript_10188/m.26443 type:complete len:103 (-) Transcript_10188:404-712(-)
MESRRMEDLIPRGQEVRPDSDLLDILSATTGNFDVVVEEREREQQIKVQALGRWTELSGTSLAHAEPRNATIQDLASKIRELTREKHRLYQSIQTRQVLLFG